MEWDGVAWNGMNVPLTGSKLVTTMMMMTMTMMYASHYGEAREPFHADTDDAQSKLHLHRMSN